MFAITEIIFVIKEYNNNIFKKVLTIRKPYDIILCDEMKKAVLVMRLASHENNLSRYISVCVHIISYYV